MKLRLTSNSIRFRVTPSELETLRKTGQLASRTQFGPAANESLAFVLESSDETRSATVRFTERVIRVLLPKDVVAHWAESDEVAIKSSQRLTESAALDILVEKDFHCLDPSGDKDESDRFPNPAVCKPVDAHSQPPEAEGAGKV